MTRPVPAWRLSTWRKICWKCALFGTVFLTSIITTAIVMRAIDLDQNSSCAVGTAGAPGYATAN